MAGLASLTLVGDRRLLPSEVGMWSRARFAALAPLLLAGLYVAWGSLTRQALTPDIRMSVRVAALAAVVTAGVMLAAWPRLGPALARVGWSARRGVVALALIAAVNLAVVRAMGGLANHEELRSVAGDRACVAPGTLVQGKLANGLALNNTIRPLFIGPGFGNYADRLERPDVAWILTYSHPRLGYEGAVVRDLLDAMPGWSTQVEVPVAETRGRRRPCRADQKTCPIGSRQIQLIGAYD